MTIELGVISGMMVGVELADGEDEGVRHLVLDLAIFRLIFTWGFE